MSKYNLLSTTVLFVYFEHTSLKPGPMLSNIYIGPQLHHFTMKHIQ